MTWMWKCCTWEAVCFQLWTSRYEEAILHSRNGTLFWAYYCGDEWGFLYGIWRWVNVYSALRFRCSVGIYVTNYRKWIWNDEWNYRARISLLENFQKKYKLKKSDFYLWFFSLNGRKYSKENLSFYVRKSLYIE